jgi:arylamine N-acetyltransferase
MVNIVYIDGAKYLVDVGFSPHGPSEPLRLQDGQESKDGINFHRLLWTNIPENTDPSQRLWVLQVRQNEQAAWAYLYCFTELEFLPQDYELMGYARSHMQTSFLTFNVIAARHDVEDGEVIGSVILLGAELRKKRKNQVVVQQTCANEQERIQALEKHFGIVLSDEERAAIRGKATELKG